MPLWPCFRESNIVWLAALPAPLQVRPLQDPGEQHEGKRVVLQTGVLRRRGVGV